MKRLLLALSATAALVAVAQGPARAADQTIVFGVAAEPYPPFADKTPAGTWEGFEPDLSRLLCQQMKAKCQITEIAWDGIIPALLAHKIDVIFASMSITDERRKTIAFSLPYYDTPVVVVAPKAEPLDPTNLAGKTIGVQIGTVEADWLKKYYAGKATIKTYQTQDESNADLLAGRTDLMVLDGVAAGTFIQSSVASGMEIKATLAHDPLFGDGVGAGLRQGDAALKAKLDAAILAVHKDGAYAALDKKYFGAVNVWPPASEFH